LEGELTQNVQAALAGVFKDSYDQVVSHFARRLDNDTAQDAAALVFAKLASAVEQGNTDPVRLLPLIVNEVAWKGARDAARRREEPAGLAADIAELLELGIARPLTYAEHRFTADFDTAIRALEDETRDAFILTELRGLTTREAGDVLDTSHTTVRRRAEAARLTVRREIA
jgi:RNA polymerase sigma factor (sigma-70 family)